MKCGYCDKNYLEPCNEQKHPTCPNFVWRQSNPAPKKKGGGSQKKGAGSKKTAAGAQKKGAGSRKKASTSGRKRKP